MALLTREDWELLRNKYNVTFSRMHSDLFNLLLDKVYGSTEASLEDTNDRGELDDIDAMMIYLARAEPPIRPADKLEKASEPPIRPEGDAASYAEPPIRPAD